MSRNIPSSMSSCSMSGQRPKNPILEWILIEYVNFKHVMRKLPKHQRQNIRIPCDIISWIRIYSNPWKHIWNSLNHWCSSWIIMCTVGYSTKGMQMCERFVLKANSTINYTKIDLHSDRSRRCKAIFSILRIAEKQI